MCKVHPICGGPPRSKPPGRWNLTLGGFWKLCGSSNVEDCCRYPIFLQHLKLNYQLDIWIHSHKLLSMGRRPRVILTLHSEKGGKDISHYSYPISHCSSWNVLSEDKEVGVPSPHTYPLAECYPKLPNIVSASDDGCYYYRAMDTSLPEMSSISCSNRK